MSSPVSSLLTSRDNSLNAVRLGLAAAVILAHSWPLGGYGASAMERFGTIGVNGFFALSGLLIAGSRLRNGFGTYIWRRAKRIFPGFWACLAVTGFVLAPLGGVIGGHGWNPADSLAYVLDNAALVMTTPAIGGTLAGAPNPGMWNGSLWTLMYEFAAYLLCGAALGIVWVRRHLVASAAVAAVALPLLSWWVGELSGAAHMITSALRLFTFFAVGVLAYALRDWLRTTTPPRGPVRRRRRGADRRERVGAQPARCGAAHLRAAARRWHLAHLDRRPRGPLLRALRLRLARPAGARHARPRRDRARARLRARLLRLRAAAGGAVVATRGAPRDARVAALAADPTHGRPPRGRPAPAARRAGRGPAAAQHAPLTPSAPPPALRRRPAPGTSAASRG
ncbi:acyltransferase family protein [Janibacter hoylei]|uniref:acyltransferase family protein n=1 Tax=Janibacter hoylei TaxID=364298 RepID=UPI0002D5B80F|nr:acyltransferase [Janibacter hoylei]